MLIVLWFYSIRVMIIFETANQPSLFWSFCLKFPIHFIVRFLKHYTSDGTRWNKWHLSFDRRFIVLSLLSCSQSKYESIHCRSGKLLNVNNSLNVVFLLEFTWKFSDIYKTESSWYSIRLWMSWRTRLLSVLATNQLDG